MKKIESWEILAERNLADLKRLSKSLDSLGTILDNIKDFGESIKQAIDPLPAVAPGVKRGLKEAG